LHLLRLHVLCRDHQGPAQEKCRQNPWQRIDSE
jgi:hypothetical protein